MANTSPPPDAHSLMLSSLTQHFMKHADQRAQLAELVDGNTAISLRLLDWFVTHYSKEHNVTYWLVGPGQELSETFGQSVPTAMGGAPRKINVYLEYRSQLRAFSKHAFDPFRRHNRISFVVASSPLRTIDTTVGQMNFFRWAIQSRVIEYVLKHLTAIEDSMSAFQQERRNNRAAISESEAVEAPVAKPLAKARRTPVVKAPVKMLMTFD